MSDPRTTSCVAPDQGTTHDMAMLENPLSAFAAVQLDTRRSLHKPRTSGLTMISEWGLGPHALADFLSIAAPYVDMVKIPTGSARLYGLEQLRAKLARYRGERISSLIGGQFQEYVLHTEGEAALPRHFDDVRAAGFDLVEISDNIVAVEDGTRRGMIRLAQDRGMGVIAEIGSKQLLTDPAQLIAEADRRLQEGVALVIVEARELIAGGKINTALIAAIEKSGLRSRIMMEVPTPRIGSTTVEIYEVKKALVRTFGPDVNIGNISPDLVLETETTRLGLGASGPLSLMPVSAGGSSLGGIRRNHSGGSYSAASTRRSS
jgi:phosphosulfolactate synthase